MNGAWPFLAVGLLLIILLILPILRARATGRDESSENGKTPAAPRREPLSPELPDRLFGSEDWDFIVRQGSPRLTRLFLQERTALALSWLRSVRANARRLIRVHREAARTSPRLEPHVELMVAADYLLFEMLCQLIVFVIWLRGPVAMGRLVGYADGLSARLHEVITKMLPADLAYGNGKGGPTPPPGARGR